MASNQIGREEKSGERELRRVVVTTGGGDRAKSHHTAGQMGGGFGSSGEKQSYAEKARTGNASVAGAHGGEGRSTVAGGEQPSPEEIGKYRAAAQQKSMEALVAAENRYAKAKESESQRQGQDITGVINQQEEEETGYGVADTVASAAQKTKDAALTAGKTAAQYSTRATVTAKDAAVKAGWGTAQLTASAAVGGTKMAANTIQGVTGYVAPAVANAAHKGAEIAANTFNAATDTMVSTGESARDYAARKKEEARGGMSGREAGEPGGGGGGLGEGARDFVTGRGVVEGDDGEDKRKVEEPKSTFYKYD